MDLCFQSINLCSLGIELIRCFSGVLSELLGYCVRFFLRSFEHFKSGISDTSQSDDPSQRIRLKCLPEVLHSESEGICSRCSCTSDHHLGFLSRIVCRCCRCRCFAGCCLQVLLLSIELGLCCQSCLSAGCCLVLRCSQTFLCGLDLGSIPTLLSPVNFVLSRLHTLSGCYSRILGCFQLGIGCFYFGSLLFQRCLRCLTLSQYLFLQSRTICGTLGIQLCFLE